jgi:hypothetical protein
MTSSSEIIPSLFQCGRRVAARRRARMYLTPATWRVTVWDDPVDTPQGTETAF